MGRNSSTPLHAPEQQVMMYNPTHLTLEPYKGQNPAHNANTLYQQIVINVEGVFLIK